LFGPFSQQDHGRCLRFHKGLRNFRIENQCAMDETGEGGQVCRIFPVFA